jgi:signal transduction histidine kinase
VLASEQSTPAERRDAAVVVTRATGRMSRLLDDLLATARKRSAAFVDREVDLAGLARAVAEEHTLLAAERSLRLDLRLSAGPVVYADPQSLDRALSNLLSNAVRLAPVGSSITVGVGSRQGWAWAAVGDEGPGIPDAERSEVFERFHRGPTDQTGGSGLGLAIARQIAESHDGRLVLADRAGPGSTFVLWLPERAVAGAPDRSATPPELDPLRA